jgi:hypothetical protein
MGRVNKQASHSVKWGKKPGAAACTLLIHDIRLCRRQR